MCIFTKDRLQETLWLEGVGIIPEEAIMESGRHFRWRHR